jgi:protein involved in polysaccharide export with SLBB domain
MSKQQFSLFSKVICWLQSTVRLFISVIFLITYHSIFAAELLPSPNNTSGSSTTTGTTTSSALQTINTVQPTSSTALSPMSGLSSLPGQSINTTVVNTLAAPINQQANNHFDYSANLKSDVFGTQLFSGNFARQGVTQFNPDYMVTIGDQIQIRFWGGYVFDSILTVDPQGNIFLPQIGPIKVLGVHNQDLQYIVESASKRVFRSNVFSYASLASAHPVRIFVGGFVNRPGLYHGTSMDSLLHYLDQAGGIDPERGSFLNVQVKRGRQVRTTVNLYDFLLQGRIPLVQLADGDVVFVSARQNTVKVSGEAKNAKRFEFQGDVLSVTQLSRLAKPLTRATHVRIVHNFGKVRNVDYYTLALASEVQIHNGDEVEFTADKKNGTISVRVEGEHQSPQEYVLNYGSRMGELLGKIKFSDRSDTNSIQLYRESVKERQKARLEVSLKSLESTALSARSSTDDEALIRKEEASRILQWINRAKTIEPSGQVLISDADNRDDLLLENGDIIKIPSRDGLVLVGGEVMFPNSIAYDPSLNLNNYINLAGGYTQNADDSRIIVLHRDGSVDDASSSSELRAGDSIMIMPKVDSKYFQIGKELIQILFQIGIAASVLLLL